MLLDRVSLHSYNTVNRFVITCRLYLNEAYQ